MSSWHVTPNNDLKSHAESTTCFCNPRVEYINGNMIIIHNAFDGREGIEWAKEILNIRPLPPAPQTK